jgi:hypothetical protein
MVDGVTQSEITGEVPVLIVGGSLVGLSTARRGSTAPGSVWFRDLG